MTSNRKNRKTANNILLFLSIAAIVVGIVIAAIGILAEFRPDLLRRAISVSYVQMLAPITYLVITEGLITVLMGFFGIIAAGNPRKIDVYIVFSIAFFMMSSYLQSRIGDNLFTGILHGHVTLSMAISFVIKFLYVWIGFTVREDFRKKH